MVDMILFAWGYYRVSLFLWISEEDMPFRDVIWMDKHVVLNLGDPRIFTDDSTRLYW